MGTRTGVTYPIAKEDEDGRKDDREARAMDGEGVERYRGGEDEGKEESC